MPRSPYNIGPMTPQKLGLLSAAIPSPAGDVVGLLADSWGYAKEPETLTPTAGLLSVAGLLPLVPSGSKVKAAKEAAEAASDYRGLHRAPGRGGGAPLHAVNRDVYPDDIYGMNAAQYYGHGEPFDWDSVSVIHALRDRPNATVTAYRAVPYEKTNAQKLAKIEKQMAAYMRRRIVPPEWGGSRKAIGDEKGFYEWASAEAARLRGLPDEPAKKIGINPGDWVTTSRAYAKQHGESTLGGNYKIVAKKVRAKDLWTDGNSIHEWGYDPEL